MPIFARSIRRAIIHCVDWKSITHRLAKTDGDDINKNIVVKAIDYLIKFCGPTITNVASQEAINLEDLKKSISVCLYIVFLACILAAMQILKISLYNLYIIFIVCLLSFSLDIAFGTISRIRENPINGAATTIPRLKSLCWITL